MATSVPAGACSEESDILRVFKGPVFFEIGFRV